MMSRLTILIFFILSYSFTIAQNTISVIPSRDTILIGDHLTVDVVLNATDLEDLASIDFTAWRSLTNLVYQQDTNYFVDNTIPSIIGDNQWKISDNYFSVPAESMEGWFVKDKLVRKPITISIYDDGVFLLPAPKIITKSGKTYPQLESARIFVLDPNAGMAQDSISLMPIKEIIQESVTWEDYKIYLYILAFIILAPFLIKLLFGNKKGEEEIIIEKEDFIPAHIKALTSLSQLKNKNLWQNGEVKSYQSELTEIIRRYLEDRFEVNALEMTTDEITRALSTKDFEAKHSSTLQRILQIADLVKFAKADPPIDINEQFMTEAIGFVENTKQSDEEVNKIIEEQNTSLIDSSISKDHTVIKKNENKNDFSIKGISNIIGKFGFPLLLMIIGSAFILNYFSNDILNRKSQLEQLMDNGLKINGVYDDNYKETTIYGAKRHDFTYSFIVGNNKYRGNISLDSLPPNNDMIVHYIEDNPTINSANPQLEYENLKSDLSTKSLLIGLGIFLLGFLIIINYIRKHLKGNNN